VKEKSLGQGRKKRQNLVGGDERDWRIVKKKARGPDQKKSAGGEGLFEGNVAPALNRTSQKNLLQKTRRVKRDQHRVRENGIDDITGR